MTRLTRTLVSGLGLVMAPAAMGATLLASHYNGKLYTLAFTQNGTSGSLAITYQTTGCGTTPGWLELYPESKTLDCFDESWAGNGTDASFWVDADGKLTLASQVPTTGNDVHGLLYGGPDGKSFVATAQ